MYYDNMISKAVILNLKPKKFSTGFSTKMESTKKFFSFSMLHFC